MLAIILGVDLSKRHVNGVVSGSGITVVNDSGSDSPSDAQSIAGSETPSIRSEVSKDPNNNRRDAESSYKALELVADVS